MGDKEIMSKINPQAETVSIGKRAAEMEDITIYPLSIADQIEMSSLIREALKAFFKQGSKDDQKDAEKDKSDFETIENKADLEFVSFIIDLLQSQIPKLLTLITDYTTEPKAAKLLAKITNNQATEIAEKVYRMNYEDASKKLIGLFKKATSQTDQREEPPKNSLKRPSQQSWSVTPGSDLNISSGTALETVG